MPLYDYECVACGHTFEKYVSVDDRDAVECGECGRRVRRLFNSTPFTITHEYVRKSPPSGGSGNVDEIQPRSN